LKLGNEEKQDIMRKPSIYLTLAIVFGLASSVHGTVLVNDTWADGNRTSTGPDGSGIDSAWFAASSSTLTVPAAGTLRGRPPTGSATWQTYFAPQGSPVTLGSTGNKLKVTWVFTPTGVNGGNTSQGFNLAVAMTPVQATTDGSFANQAFKSYAMWMNMGTTLGNANPFQLREWSLAGSGSLLGSSANYTSLANGVASGAPGYTGGTTYTYEMTLTRNGAGMDIVSTMTGGTLNTTGIATISFTDTTANTFTFDTFMVRPSGSASAASQFDTTLFKVEFIPEPSTAVLAGLGLLGLVFARRMRR
jgi:hypothetical protein